MLKLGPKSDQKPMNEKPQRLTESILSKKKREKVKTTNEQEEK